MDGRSTERECERERELERHPLSLSITTDHGQYMNPLLQLASGTNIFTSILLTTSTERIRITTFGNTDNFNAMLIRFKQSFSYF